MDTVQHWKINRFSIRRCSCWQCFQVAGMLGSTHIFYQNTETEPVFETFIISLTHLTVFTPWRADCLSNNTKKKPPSCVYNCTCTTELFCLIILNHSVCVKVTKRKSERTFFITLLYNLWLSSMFRWYQNQTTEQHFEWHVVCLFKVIVNHPVPCVTGSPCDYYDRLPTARNQIIFF